MAGIWSGCRALTMALAKSFSSSFASMQIAVVIESVTLHPVIHKPGTHCHKHRSDALHL